MYNNNNLDLKIAILDGLTVGDYNMLVGEKFEYLLKASCIGTFVKADVYSRSLNRKWEKWFIMIGN